VHGAISHFFMAFKFHIIFPYVLLHEKALLILTCLENKGFTSLHKLYFFKK